MTSEEQVKANRKNALQSTGPRDCSKTKFNSVKYGITSESGFSKKEEEILTKIYEDLVPVFEPQNKLQELVLGRIAICIWRLQRSSHFEQIQLKNALIRMRNLNKKFNMMTFNSPFTSPDDEVEVESETVDTGIELLMRYETTNENSLIKMVRFFESLKER